MKPRCSAGRRAYVSAAGHALFMFAPWSGDKVDKIGSSVLEG